jgi:outer membrane lipoprotein-sorting protein
MVGPANRSVCTASSAALLLVFLFLQATAFASEQATPAAGVPDLTTLVRRIAEAQLDNGNRVKPYSVTREYKVFGADTVRPRTEVVAKVNFLPPNVKSYDIDQSTGGMGEKIVRHILDHEVDATRDPRTLMVNEQNYGFAFEGEDMLAGNLCYRLTIAPKHERKDLLKATIWVDKNSYHIVRMEGEPAKSP